MYEYINVLISHLTISDKAYVYKIKKEMHSKIELGSRVIVPFGPKNKQSEGFVISRVASTEITDANIKEIIRIPDDFSLFSNEMFMLANYMSNHYCTSLAQCLNAIIPQGVTEIKQKPNQKKTIRLSDFVLQNIEEIRSEYSVKKMLARQLELIEYLYENRMQSVFLKTLEDFNRSTIKTMEQKGLLLIEETEEKKRRNPNAFISEKLTLSSEQSKVLSQIDEWREAGGFSECLLKGVTGSGKTELYIKLIERVISEGKTAIMLVPEINLTPQMIERFEKRFANLSIMHSKLSNMEQLVEWKKAKDGVVDVVIGPRSALFMPLENVGVIILDEEHEGTYKSENSPKYQTREVAQFRAKHHEALLVYGSATPSVETYYRVKTGDLKCFELNTRYNQKPLPEMHVIDMCMELENGNRSIFSSVLYEKIREKLERREQILLFLNRRGHSTFVSCRKCGFVMKCSKCLIPYVYHSNTNQLKCHYCYETIENTNICPNCKSKAMKYFGIGTQKIEEEAGKIFPDARILRLDSDTSSRKNAGSAIVKMFKEQEADILIGTQMITKGHNFPEVTLVGVVAADTMLNIQDFRASERTFQLITQVAGRTGRGEKQGEVYIQTYERDHYAIQKAMTYNYEEFYQEELLFREQMKCPPFKRLFYIMLTFGDEQTVIGEINELASCLLYDHGEIELLGPAPAGITRINGIYRWQILLRHVDEERLKRYAMSRIEEFRKNRKSLKSQIQINFD